MRAGSSPVVGRGKKQMKGETKKFYLIALALMLTGCDEDGKVERKDNDAEVTVSEMLLVEKAPEESSTHKEFLKKFSVDRVSFGFDRNELSTQDKEYLSKVAEHLMVNVDLRVEVQGNCDKRGSIDYNNALGERRANVVLEFLKSKGVAHNRLNSVSFGSRVLVPGDDEEAYAKNRVAILVIK